MRKHLLLPMAFLAIAACTNTKEGDKKAQLSVVPDTTAKMGKASVDEGRWVGTTDKLSFDKSQASKLKACLDNPAGKPIYSGNDQYGGSFEALDCGSDLGFWEKLPEGAFVHIRFSEDVCPELVQLTRAVLPENCLEYNAAELANYKRISESKQKAK